MKSKRAFNKKQQQNETSQAGDSSNNEVAKKKKKNGDDLYAPLTRDELYTIKETENLYKSGLFRMQIDELLKEVKLKKLRNKHIDRFLHALRDYLINIPNGQEDFALTDPSCLPEGVAMPITLTDCIDLKGRFSFKTPTIISVVGSYMIGSITKPIVNIDVTVEVPKECLQHRDHINARYYYRRAIYLSILAHHLINSKLCQEIQFSTMNGDPLKPILVLQPANQFNNSFYVRLYPCIDQSVFKLNQLKPTKDNIRWDFFPKLKSQLEQDVENFGPPTPHYNHGILVDMNFSKHLREIHAATAQNPALLDGIVLIKTWLYQREFNNLFNGFLASMFVLYLLTKRRINIHMSSYQIVRVFLLELATSDWTSNGITMADLNNVEIPSVAEFHAVFEVVFIDSTGYLNLTANLSKVSYEEIRHAAALSLHYLDDNAVEAFSGLFIINAPFFTRYDHYIILKELPLLDEVNMKQELLEGLIARCNYLRPLMVSWIVNILRRGLNERIKLLSVMPEETKKWPVEEVPPAETTNITIGILVDSERYSSIVEMGPSAEDVKAAAVFRTFWGQKAELRRFKDGAIKEAVIWQCNNIAERRYICHQIVKHLLQLHGKLSEDTVTYVANQLDRSLCIACDGNLSQCDDTVEENMIDILRVFDELSKQLRNLTELPLTVNSLQGISPIFRHTEVFPAKPAKRFKSSTILSDDDDDVSSQKIAKGVLLPSANKTCPEWIPANEVICQMELSGNWPQNTEAIERVKAAFHLKIAQLISEQYSLHAVGQSNYVDVLKDGYIFRIRIAYRREIGLLRLDPIKENEQLASELEKYTITLPRFTTAINGLYEQHHAFGATARLAKRWVSSHLLAGYITEECTEAVVAALFLNPQPYDPPGSGFTGFLRYLKLISTFDWQNFPLFININNDFTETDMDEISTEFRENRCKFPAMFVAIPKANSNVVITGEKLTAQILHRLIVLAKESYAHLYKLLSMHGYESENVDFMAIFRSPLDDYDVIIKLKIEYVARFYQNIDALVKDTTSSINRKYMPVVEFDPVERYVLELEDTFGDIALFFYNKYGGDFVAVVWKPNAFESQPFKVGESHCKAIKKHNDSKKWIMTADKESVVQEFYLLGEGLVSSIRSK